MTLLQFVFADYPKLRLAITGKSVVLVSLARGCLCGRTLRIVIFIFARGCLCGRKMGIVILISDFFDSATHAYQKGLISLVGQQFEVAAIQILSRAEQQPNFSGEVQLTDIETGKSKEITASAQVLAGYQRRLQQFLARTVQFCHEHAITYLLTTNESSLEQVILHDLRQTGLVQ